MILTPSELIRNLLNVVLRLNVTTFPSYHILCQKGYDRKEEEERKCKSLKNRGKMIKDKK